MKLLDETGATVIDNSWVEKDGLEIGGLTSAIVTNYQEFRERRGGDQFPNGARYPHWERRRGGSLKPETAWLEEFETASGYKVLLCHHPEYYDPYLKARDIDLIFSGHAHGGQMRLFGHGLYAPGQGWVPKYTRGVYDGRLVVSAGLANTASPVPRIFNPTEIVYLELGD